MQVKFCPIDARDNIFCGYNTVAFSSEDGPVEDMSKENQLTSALMEAEYLSKLAILQKFIVDKYQPSWLEDGQSVDRQDYSVESQELAKRVYPGPYAKYYT